ncbi:MULTISPECIES: NAD(P)-dependent oxidoreductase [unclassified Duganella]|uniref:NAD-dependent epimerase/dehydratase family protein n=1 Tax=unclassified Duganella TaxID=2636909 RepID=UPI0006F40BB0|nr:MULTISPECIES: NAD(P)-dependent oxidoreductase [unclassified Duganella]KQV47553.1 epimerase [Duganella sp. Root336D2]KRC00034.1 epimerase [Duganella sp. Root198D2]
MSRVAILGANSQIAKDLILSLAREGRRDLLLYVRDQAAMRDWLAARQLDCAVHGYDSYGSAPHEAVLNFVGVGDPQRAARMGGDIFAITQQYDDLALAGLRANPERRYLFLSSGAAYGSGFLQPAGPDTVASLAINHLAPQDYYAVAKLHAECKHRAMPDHAITDLRVFNYFSRSQDLAGRFFITDILRAIRDGQVLQASDSQMVRDYLHPDDFHRMVACVLDGAPGNLALDCYSRAPISKTELLSLMQQRFGLRYELAAGAAGVNATGGKPHYYSTQRLAAALGYQPAYSSAEGVAAESAIILASGSAPKMSENR